VTDAHSNVTAELETAVASSSIGAGGPRVHGLPAGVVTLTGVPGTDTLPALSRARTAYWYVVEDATFESV
jgi:hypothetical protein